MLTLVSYDIEDDGERNKVHKVLQGHGQRVQYSVFECWLEDDDLQQLKARLTPHVKGSLDSVRFYRICGACVAKVEVVGFGDRPKQDEVWIV